MKKILNIIAMMLLLILSSCGGSSSNGGSNPDDGVPVISQFTLTAKAGAAASGEINQSAHQIAVIFDQDISLSNLVATFTAIGNVTVNGVAQASGVTSNDFSSPLNYTVSTSKGSVTYVVTAAVQTPDTADMVEFSLPGQLNSVINGSNITVYMPYTTTEEDLSSLAATFVTNGSVVKVGSTTQNSGETKNDFNSAVVYSITSANGQVTKNYTVNVIVDANNNSKYIPASTWRMQCIVGDTFNQIKKSAKSCNGADLHGLVYQAGNDILSPVIDLTGSNFAGANLAGANLIFDNLSSCQFVNANLDGLKFGGNEIANANFTGASLVGATPNPATDFESVNFNQADFTGASISGAPSVGESQYIIIHNASFTGTVFGSGTSFTYDQMNNVTFKPSAWPAGVSFANSIIESAIFDGAEVSAVSTPSFSFATLTNVSFNNFASPTSWAFAPATLTNVIFSFSGSPSGFSFAESSTLLNNVTFNFTSGQTVSGWNFSGAHLNNVTFAGNSSNTTGWVLTNAIFTNLHVTSKFGTCAGMVLTGATCGGSACQCSDFCNTCQ